jgi:hypothetical protein
MAILRLCDASKEGDTAAKSLIVGDRKGPTLFSPTQAATTQQGEARLQSC